MKELLLTITIVLMIYLFLYNFIIASICTIPVLMVYSLIEDIINSFNDYKMNASTR